MVLAVKVPAGRSVRNVLVVVVVLPSVPVAVTVTVYLAEVCSGHTVCQEVCPWSVPAAVMCPAVTLTVRILPCLTVTVRPRPVFTFLLPFAGLIATVAPLLATVVVPPPVPWLLAGPPDDDEPEQAVASRHIAPTTPVTASPARRRMSRGRPVSVRSLSRTLVLLWYQRSHGATPTTTVCPQCGVLGRQRGYRYRSPRRCRFPRRPGSSAPDPGRYPPIERRTRRAGGCLPPLCQPDVSGDASGSTRRGQPGHKSRLPPTEPYRRCGRTG